MTNTLSEAVMYIAHLSRLSLLISLCMVLTRLSKIFFHHLGSEILLSVEAGE